MSDKIVKDLVTRVKKLEDAIFVGKTEKSASSTKQSFRGAKGGCELLITKNFFNKKHTAPQVREKLVSLDYHYNIQVVQTALNRLSTKTGLLLSFKEGSDKYYVIRK